MTRGDDMTPATVDPTRPLTIEECVRRQDDGRKTGLVRGRIVEVPPTDPYHGFVRGRVFQYVERFVEFVGEENSAVS
jgi:hypothetical protein